MIPLKGNIPTRRFPILTVSLIVINVIVFVMDSLNRVKIIGYPILTQYGFVRPISYIGALTLHYSMVPYNVTTGAPGAWLTIFTSMFLHANWLHIGGNMLYLWIFGSVVEDALGRPRYLLFYFVAGFAAALAQIYSNPLSQVPTIGASGAIAGVMGAYLILYPGASILSIVPIFFIGMLMNVPAVLVIGFWALLQFVDASWLGGGDLQGGGIAYFAHIGGFATGVILILLMGGRNLLYKKRGYYDP